MVEITAKLKAAAGPAQERLVLPFALRQKSRLRARLASGEEVALMLPRGEVLRGGEHVRASDGRAIEVVAEEEDLLHVECSGPVELAKAAYHLGNRHVPVELGKGYLRLAPDHVLEEMLKRLGASVRPVRAPFEPEAGAYGGGHRHDEMGHGGKIHEFGSDSHAHPHPHRHE